MAAGRTVAANRSMGNEKGGKWPMAMTNDPGISKRLRLFSLEIRVAEFACFQAVEHSFSDPASDYIIATCGKSKHSAEKVKLLAHCRRPTHCGFETGCYRTNG